MSVLQQRPVRRVNPKRLLVFVMAVLAALLVVVGGIWLLSGTQAVQQHPSIDLGVLIDAGHGGSDIGAKGVSGVEEDKLNLQVANKLKEELESRGVTVTMTRSTDDAIGPTKDEDMQNRAEIIGASSAAVMVSIHMNSFPDDPSVWGPQVFYQRDSVTGKDLAGYLQKPLNAATGGKRQPNPMGLFVLQAAPMPAVLVECGFLSNAEDESKLADPEHQQALARAIADGILEYCK